MSNRQALHALIDSLDEEFVDDLLDRIESEKDRSAPSLSRDALESLARGLAQAAAGAAVSHDEAMRLVGLDP